eukprot:CAMPEP_0182901208 /NCGR_PEP_ID=MMETSP0034_2-20130328/29452_1 /TAXON_ID=156128 /ORGANISM="Nephroselmis pyriformis, Strain CCMP717" /LENGTH=315 /DNA_ID=CAMNT_0025035557 /DNA_START=63 /DNA_END=1007 /DNA_ORIENTATION=-
MSYNNEKPTTAGRKAREVLSLYDSGRPGSRGGGEGARTGFSSREYSAWRDWTGKEPSMAAWQRAEDAARRSASGAGIDISRLSVQGNARSSEHLRTGGGFAPRGAKHPGGGMMAGRPESRGTGGGGPSQAGHVRYRGVAAMGGMMGAGASASRYAPAGVPASGGLSRSSTAPVPHGGPNARGGGHGAGYTSLTPRESAEAALQYRLRTSGPALRPSGGTTPRGEKALRPSSRARGAAPAGTPPKTAPAAPLHKEGSTYAVKAMWAGSFAQAEGTGADKGRTYVTLSGQETREPAPHAPLSGGAPLGASSPGGRRL